MTLLEFKLHNFAMYVHTGDKILFNTHLARILRAICGVL